MSITVKLPDMEKIIRKSGDLDYPPISGLIGMWDAINADRGDCKKNNPILFPAHANAWVCPISLKITDGAGVGLDSNTDVAYIGFEKPCLVAGSACTFNYDCCSDFCNGGVCN